VYEQFFFIFSKANTKIIPLIIFHVFTLLIHVNISIILKSNFTEKKDIYKHYMYEHISYDYA